MFTKDELKAEASRLGFPLCGVTSPDRPAGFEKFLRWVESGRHAGMQYLASPHSLAARADPRIILPDCQSILVLAAPYPPPLSSNPSSLGRIAAYAHSDDYHDLLPPLLKALASWITERAGVGLQWRICIDTAPVLEKELAQRAGLGWIGRNTCLINPRLGSWFFLAELFIDLPIDPDQPFPNDRCGSCHRCVDACPTAAILPDRTLDANRCLSFLTIENKGSIPAELRPAVGNNVFGCDICQTVCPWNQKPSGQPPQTLFSPKSLDPDQRLADDLGLDNAGFLERYQHTPVLRAKRRGYLRNVAIALGNYPQPRSVSALAACLQNEPEPLVRAHAAWALGQIPHPRALAALQNALITEISLPVLDEIEMAIRNFPGA